MGLQISERQIEGIAVFDLRGRLVAGDEAAQFEEALGATIATGDKRAILNLEHVGFIDSTGLGAMVEAYSQFKHAGGMLKLLNASKRHAELLTLTKLSTVFEIFDDEQAAIDSFFPDRAVRKFDILEFVKSEEEQEKS